MSKVNLVSEQALRLNSSLLVDHPGLQTYKVETDVQRRTFQEFLRAMETGSDLSFTPNNFTELSLLCDEFGAVQLKRARDRVLQTVSAGSAVDFRLTNNEICLEERENGLVSRLSQLHGLYLTLETVCAGLRADVTKLQNSIGELQVQGEIGELRSGWEKGIAELKQLNDSLRAECKTCTFNIPFQKGKSGGGILAHLSENHDGSLHGKGVITITSKSMSEQARRLDRRATCGWGRVRFVSKAESGQWVCWDFHQRRLRPTHYTVEAQDLQSWVVEGSLDGVAWVEIDRQTDTKVFKGGNLKNEVFSVARPVECRLLRLTQTGKDHKGQNRLRLQWVDFFGSFAVALDTLLAEMHQQTSGLKARCGGIESAIAKVRGSVASLEREVDRSAVSFPMRAPKSRDGIIAYLTKKHDGDVQETTIVSVTSRSLSEDRKYALTGVTNLASNSWPRFYSQDWSCQWVRWDFQDLRIRPTHYTVRSILLKSWVIEGSRDDWCWTEIDRRTNTGAFRQLSTASFTVANPGKFRFIRLTQTGENHAGDDRLCLVGVEFFGTLFE